MSIIWIFSHPSLYMYRSVSTLLCLCFVAVGGKCARASPEGRFSLGEEDALGCSPGLGHRAALLKGKVLCVSDWMCASDGMVWLWDIAALLASKVYGAPRACMCVCVCVVGGGF